MLYKYIYIFICIFVYIYIYTYKNKTERHENSSLLFLSFLVKTFNSRRSLGFKEAIAVLILFK